MTPNNEQQLLQRKVRLRPELEWSVYSESKPTTWIARDPVSLEYFHFSSLEKSFVDLLDGSRTLREVLTAKPRLGIDASWLIQLISKLENACFCVPRDAGAGRRLWKGRQRQEIAGTWQKLLSPIAVRIRLFDPTNLLDKISWLARLLFAKTFVWLWLAVAVPLCMLVIVQCVEAPERLFAGLDSLTSTRAIALVLVYIIVKSIHELGHALACKRWRAECHEIGLFFLVFAPILYCDVSDSWTLTSRWRRASVALAGIYVELLLATFASALWLVTSDATWINSVAANVILVCSLNTILVNANPLLRYDGYYVLSDLWGVPNLADQGKEAAWEFSLSAITGDRLPTSRWDAGAGQLAAYGFASWLYRQFVVVLIAWVVWNMLDNLGLQLIGAGLVSLLAFNVLRANVRGFIKWTRELIMGGRLDGFGWLRFSAAILVVLCIGAIFFYKPLPTFVISRGVTKLVDINPIYAKQTGTLERFATFDQYVSAGQPIAIIESPELQLRRLDAAAQVSLLQQRIQQLELLSVDTETAATELANAAAELAKQRDMLGILDEEIQSLAILAEGNGKLVGGNFERYQPVAERANNQQQTPILDQRNIGRGIERGQLLGWYTSGPELYLTAYVAEHDAEQLWEGMQVRCKWDCRTNQLYSGTVKRIAPEPISEIPEPLIGDESIIAKASIGSSNQNEPAVPHYEVTITMQAMPNVLGHLSLATVYFETSPRTMSQSLRRILDLNIRPEL